MGWPFWQVDEALGVLREMVARGCERNTMTYAALVAACERARRPGAARELFAEMQREGVKPNVSIYNNVIAACSQSEYSPFPFEVSSLSSCTADVNSSPISSEQRYHLVEFTRQNRFPFLVAKKASTPARQLRNG